MWLNKRGSAFFYLQIVTCKVIITSEVNMKKGIQALGRLKVGQMNKTEAEYAASLENMKHAGLIAWYRFEGIKLRLADNTFYTPDFAVMRATGEMELHEVKASGRTMPARRPRSRSISARSGSSRCAGAAES